MDNVTDFGVLSPGPSVGLDLGEIYSAIVVYRSLEIASDPKQEQE